MDDEIKEIIKRFGLMKRTSNTITDPDRLLAEIQKARDNGYAFDWEEDDEDIVCVASKVMDRHGKIIAGISISGPKTRVADKLDDYRIKVMEEAYLLSTELGYRKE
jgi:DNA-binding IclR family transcriptional regulator